MKHKVQIDGKVYFAEDNTLLSELLIHGGFAVEHPCGGMGRCGKCTVTVDGNKELSCRYRITRDITVVLPENGEIQSESGVKLSENGSSEKCLALDIGTTTLALALVNINDGSVSDIKKCTNPQRRFGADIMTRIDYCSKNGVKELHNVLIPAVNKLISDIGGESVGKMYVSGNATMLHTFLNENPSSMGVYPYTPVFLEARNVTASDIGICGAREITTLPSIAAFVGADIVGGLNYVKAPEKGRLSILIDLGTNAEIVLFDDKSSVCTAAAAGPCFEGANISSGMSALPGAVYAYGKEGAKVIGDGVAVGICGTGLVDVVAYLLTEEIMDETGYMECEEFTVSGDVTLTQNDIRQYQLAKSAIYSAVLTLMKMKSVDFADIEKVYISGGFSAEINIENAVATGLLPSEFTEKCVPVYNSSLLGTVKFASRQNDLLPIISGAKYVDLSADKYFSDLFIESMLF